jgi:hypothetical protein
MTDETVRLEPLGHIPCWTHHESQPANSYVRRNRINLQR